MEGSKWRSEWDKSTSITLKADLGRKKGNKNADGVGLGLGGRGA